MLATTSAPPTARPAQEAKSKGKIAVQSAPAPVTKAVVISSVQHTFAYLSRAAVRNVSCLQGAVAFKMVDSDVFDALTVLVGRHLYTRTHRLTSATRH